MFIFRVLHTVPYSNREGAKDFIASLHCYFTCNLLIGLAVLLSWKQFGASRVIECMLPPEFTSSWIQYAENLCWAEDTYYVPFTEAVEGLNETQKAERKISYYQWMPFFLLFQACCFQVPAMIWHYFASQSGIRVGEILRVATDETNAVPDVRSANINALCTHLQGALRFHKRLQEKRLLPHKFLRILNLKYSTFYVAFLYMTSKILFLANVSFQLIILTRYVLPRSNTLFATDLWSSLWMGNTTWQDTGLFPRVSLCDFEVREMGTVVKHTVQCVLLINLFTEKVFILLFIWLLFLSVVTTLNLCSWTWWFTSETTNTLFLVNHLEMADGKFDKSVPRKMDSVHRFAKKYLRTDGLFLTKLIAQHADVCFSSKLVESLYVLHLRYEEERKIWKELKKAKLPQSIPAYKDKKHSDAVDGKTLRRHQSLDDILDSPEKRQKRDRLDTNESDEEEKEARRKKFEMEEKVREEWRRKQSEGSVRNSPSRESLKKRFKQVD